MKVESYYSKIKVIIQVTSRITCPSLERKLISSLDLESIRCCMNENDCSFNTIVLNFKTASAVSFSLNLEGTGTNSVRLNNLFLIYA